MAQSIKSSVYATDSTARVELFDFSIRTSNRLRTMRITNLEQIARTTPKEFLAIDGFGRKCLTEIAGTLEIFYSSLDVRGLASFANIVELWRPYFSHPERVPAIPCDGSFSNQLQTTSNSSDETAAEPIPLFDPAHHSQAQMLVENLPISTRARNVLKEMRIKTVNDLAQLSPGTLAGVENCGKKTIKELAMLLKGYFASLPSSGMDFYRNTRSIWLRYATSAGVSDRRSLPIFALEPQMHPVLEVIEIAIGGLHDRSSSILTRRMGLSSGQSRKTLEAIGREFQLTRERVRQIVDAALKLILRNIKMIRPDVYQSIRKLVQTHEVVSLDEVCTAIPDLGKSIVY